MATNPYRSAPAAPPTALRQEWDNRTRYAAEDYAVAEARRAQAQKDAQIARDRALGSIARNYRTQNYDARTGAGSRGMALSPSTMRRWADSLHSRQVEETAGVQETYSLALREAMRAVDDARRARDRSIDQVNAERAYYGGDHQALLPRIFR